MGHFKHDKFLQSTHISHSTIQHIFYNQYDIYITTETLQIKDVRTLFNKLIYLNYVLCSLIKLRVQGRRRLPIRSIISTVMQRRRTLQFYTQTN